MPILLEWLLVAFVLGVAIFRLEKIRTSLPLDPAVLATWVRQRVGPDGPERLARVLSAVAVEVPGRHGLGEMARLAAALAEREAGPRAAGCNEALLELELRLGPVDGDGGLVRVLVLGTVLDLALLVVAGQGASRAMLDVLGLGAGALLALLAMKRDSGQLERVGRRGIDRWVEASLEARGVEAAGAMRSGRLGRPGRGERSGRSEPSGRSPAPPAPKRL